MIDLKSFNQYFRNNLRKNSQLSYKSTIRYISFALIRIDNWFAFIAAFFTFSVETGKRRGL
jgi:hypothetical protein